MSTDRDVTTRIVRSWLHEDAHEDADRILNLVLDAIDTTPQRSAPWLARRFPVMNSNVVRIGVAAAVVVIAAIIGFNYVNSNVGSDEPTPTSTQTTIPTATPVAVPQLPPYGAGSIEPGRYSLHVPDSTVDAILTVGEGWTTGGWYLMDPPFFSKDIAFWTVENVNQDLCDPGSLPNPAIGPTVDDLVAALDAQAHTVMSPAVDVEVGGFAGKRVTMTGVDWQLVQDECVELASTESLAYFVVPGGEPGRHLEDGSIDTLWIVDVDGNRVVIVTHFVDPDDTGAATTIAGVIDSIEFLPQ